MSETVEFICLANSGKHGARCIAGLRLDSRDFFRPVSTRPTGELSEEDCCYEDGGIPAPLHVVSCEVQQPSPNAYQPENWLIDDNYYWTMLRTANSQDLERVCAAVASEGPILGCANGRVAYPLPRVMERSLSLVRPEAPRFVVRELPQSERLQARALFRFDGRDYDLPLTDWTYRSNLLDMGLGEYDPASLDIVDPDSLLFCISLGVPFYGYCYKLVAGVLEVPVNTNADRKTDSDTKRDQVHVTSGKPTRLSENHVTILGQLAKGKSYDQVLRDTPGATYLEILAAIQAALQMDCSVGPSGPRKAFMGRRYARNSVEWSQEEDDTLRQLYEGGHDVFDLAVILQRQPGHVITRLSRQGYEASVFAASPVSWSSTDLHNGLVSALNGLQGHLDAADLNAVQHLLTEAVQDELFRWGLEPVENFHGLLREQRRRMYTRVAGLIERAVVVSIEIDRANRNAVVERLSEAVGAGIMSYWVRFGPSHNLPSARGIEPPPGVFLIEVPVDG